MVHFQLPRQIASNGVKISEYSLSAVSKCRKTSCPGSCQGAKSGSKILCWFLKKNTAFNKTTAFRSPNIPQGSLFISAWTPLLLVPPNGFQNIGNKGCLRIIQALI